MKRYMKNTALFGLLLTTSAGCSLPFGLLNKVGMGQHNAQAKQSVPANTGNKKTKNNNQDQKAQRTSQSRKGDSAYSGPAHKFLLKNTIKTIDGKSIVTNPSSLLVCVDKHRNLPFNYVPTDLVVPDIPFIYGNNHYYEKMNMRKVAAGAIQQMFQAAKHDNIKLYGVSGYRSYKTQVAVFSSNVNKYGSAEKANQVSAEPGQSEHQTGLAMDVTSAKIGDQLVQKFGQTNAGIWLASNAWKYGFIIRYQKGEQAITGYEYEPWHIRYVGKVAAKTIHQNHLTLEGYLSK